MAATLGFGAAEVLAFVFSGRGLNEALGVHQDWSLGAVGRDLASAGITLSFLKLSGAGARGLLSGNEGRTAFQRFSRAALPQFAMLGGIMAGHRAEEALHLRPHVDGATTLTDALGTLLQFYVSGRLMHQAMGPELAAYQQALELRSEQLARTPRLRPRGGDSPALAELLQGMFGARRPALAGAAGTGRGESSLELPNSFMMVMDGDGNGGNGANQRPSSRPRVTPPERLTPRRPSPTPMEEALQAATRLPPGNLEVRISQNPPPPDPAGDPAAEDISFSLVEEPAGAAAPPTKASGPEIRETMLSGVPLAGTPAEPTREVDPEVARHLRRLLPGQRVGPEGRYQIQGKIAEGGSGTVFRVTDLRSGRSAAIKVPSQATKPEQLDRFRREIWISENLASGWAVPIYDHFEIFEGSGIQVPLMEYVDGITLARALYHLGLHDVATQRDFSLGRRVDLFADLCLGVQDAHLHGIVHNDLKPDNLMVDRNWRMRILDWGLARHVGEASGEGEARISPEALRHKPPRVSVSMGMGTPGYMAPEVTKADRGPNPRSQDIFSLGVILYEMATGLHPFGLYRPGDVFRGEPRLVPLRHGDHPEGQTKINPRSIFSYGIDPSLDPPPFRDILSGEHPEYLFELEGIARRAMHPDPLQRFQSAGELREAVLMARAKSDRESLDRLRDRMREAEGRLKSSWKNFNVASRIDPANWTKMHQMIVALRQDRESWHQGIEDLVTRLTGVMKYDDSLQARRMIAELSWERLVDGGDRMSLSVQEALARRIRENDFPIDPEGKTNFSALLTGRARMNFQLRILENGEDLARDLADRTQVRVLEIVREKDSRGTELGNYREGGVLVQGDLKSINGEMSLPHGYYVVELKTEGFAPVRLPLRVTRRDVFRDLVADKPLELPLEMVPQGDMGPGMVLVEGGRSFTGRDFYEDGMPSDIYSFPMHEIELATFAISRSPVTVGEYIPFIESLLEQGRIDEARLFSPRKTTPPQKISRDLLRDTWRVYREEGLRAAFEHFLNRQRGNTYNWKIRPEGFGPWKRYRLLDPTTHTDANGDPIMLEQPISAISRKAAEAYLAWLSEREGREYSLPTAEEKEKVDRNSFPWNFPWGYDFAPFYLISRLAFSGDLLNATYPQPVGKHVMDQKLYRDFSIYGTLDNLGNVREYTASNGEPTYVVLSGGSVRVPYGPFYYPASRNYAHRETTVDDSVGAFRRVLRFGRPQPRDMTPETPPVR
ncbi:MAG: bifunctional serine/threonine-protein kinase/formylglycine-generating enzyme family protein [bacterium]